MLTVVEAADFKTFEMQTQEIQHKAEKKLGHINSEMIDFVDQFEREMDSKFKEMAFDLKPADR